MWCSRWPRRSPSWWTGTCWSRGLRTRSVARPRCGTPIWATARDPDPGGARLGRRLRRKPGVPWWGSGCARRGERTGNRGNQLRGGEEQMLAIGRALMTNPRVLVLDEATEGLAPLMRDEIWRVIRVVREAGMAAIVVDKTVDAVLSIADRVV